MKKTTTYLSLLFIASTLVGCITENNVHAHTFSNKWDSNDSSHWHSATCEHKELTKDLADHFDSNEDGRCDVCNHKVENYNVVVFMDGKTLLSDPIILANNETVYQPVNPVKVGHNFIGWYDNPSLTGDFYDFETPVTKNLTLYAKFELCDYKITYHNDENIVHNDPDGYTYGTGIESFDLTAHDSTGEDKFYGWYFDEEWTKPATSIPKDLVGNVDVYAKRSKIYSIQYNDWPEEIANPNQLEYTELDEVTFNSENIEKYPGFKNIHFEENNTEVEKIPLGTTGNKIIDVKYDLTKTKVTYDPNGGKILSGHSYVKVDFGEDIGIKKLSIPVLGLGDPVNIYDQSVFPIPENEGYCFRGYFLDEEFTARISETDNNVISSGTTIYAQWEKLPEGWSGVLPNKVEDKTTLVDGEWYGGCAFNVMVPYYIKNAYMSFYIDKPFCYDGTYALHDSKIIGTKYDDTKEDLLRKTLTSMGHETLIFINEDRDISMYKSLEISHRLERSEGYSPIVGKLEVSFSKGEKNPYRSGMVAAKETSEIYEEEYSYWDIPDIMPEREGYIFCGWFDEKGSKVSINRRWVYTESELKFTASWIKK